MRSRKVLFFVCVMIPITVGSIASFITRDGMAAFEMLRQPALSPPEWLFPIVWSALYFFMGVSSYWIMRANTPKEQKEKAILLYEYQLAANFLWPTFFFHFEWYLFSFVWLVFLWLLVLRMILQFGRIDKKAAWINRPYLVWLSFAGYLNLAIWWLN